jgi:hypothetical protein
VEKLKYLGARNQDFVHEGIKSRLDMGNLCYHLFGNDLSSSLTKKNKIFGTEILPVVLYGCETWSLTLREEHRLRVPDNGLLRQWEVTREQRRLHNGELHDLYSLSTVQELDQCGMYGAEERCVQGSGGKT